MASIVDQYGIPVTSRDFFRAVTSNRDGSLPRLTTPVSSLDELLPWDDWNTIVSLSRRMFVNMGLPKGAILQKNTYAIGTGWDVIFTGEDKVWGAIAADWLNNWWGKFCDPRGRMFDWKTLLFLDGVAIDRDGDFGIVLKQSKSGYPLMQRVGANRIGQRNSYSNRVESGTYKGLRIDRGVITTPDDVPVAYRVLGSAPELDQDIDADYFIHVFDPEFNDTTRGLPVFYASIRELRSMAQSQEWEEQVMLLLSALAMVEYNDYGTADPTDPSNFDSDQIPGGSPVRSDDSTELKASFTKVGGVFVRHFKAGGDAKVQAFEQSRPSDMWDRFNDRLARITLVGANWPISMVWKATGQGTAERSDLEKAARAVEDRQMIISTYASQVIPWAVAVAVKNGFLPPNSNPADFRAFTFSMPAAIDIDGGRTIKEKIELWRTGHINSSEVVAARGRGQYESFCRERAWEVVTRKRVADEVSKESGYEVTAAEMSDAGMGGGQPGFQQDDDPKSDKSNQPKNDDEES